MKRCMAMGDGMNVAWPKSLYLLNLRGAEQAWGKFTQIPTATEGLGHHVTGRSIWGGWKHGVHEGNATRVPRAFRQAMNAMAKSVMG